MIAFTYSSCTLTRFLGGLLFLLIIAARYIPLYGDVPGYTLGEPMTNKLLCLDFEKELSEWRIMDVTQIL